MAKGKIIKLRKKLKEETQKMKNEIDGIYNRESTEGMTPEERTKWIYSRFIQPEDKNPIFLDDKINHFIDWYLLYRRKYEGFTSDQIRNLIEKVAVWYELKYPDFEVDRLMPYTNDQIKKDIDWTKYYTKEVFFESLSKEESYLLNEVDFDTLVYLNPSSRTVNVDPHLHIHKNGIVKDSEQVLFYTSVVSPNKELKEKSFIYDDELIGMNIKEVRELFNIRGILLPKDNELDTMIKEIDTRIYQREELLNCIMYRIIERGGNRVGPRRGFLFAKEFGRNIDIPMIYGADSSDPKLDLFINEYIKEGGTKNLKCFTNYFRCDFLDELDIDTVENLLLRHNNYVIDLDKLPHTENIKKYIKKKTKNK